MDDNLRHDLNNLLSTVITYAEMLAQDLPPGSQARDFAAAILKSGTEAQILINPQLKASPEAQAVRRSGMTRHVLVVDDQPDVREMIAILLEREGCTVETTALPQAALTLIRQTPDAYDLVILDQSMPQMRGDVLAREIAHDNPDIPVILITGHNPQDLPVLPENVQDVIEKFTLLTDLPMAIDEIFD